MGYQCKWHHIKPNLTPRNLPPKRQPILGGAMSECLWEEIDAFQSSGEFRRFEAWLAEQIQAGDAEQIEVKQRYAGARCKHASRTMVSNPALDRFVIRVKLVDQIDFMSWQDRS
jgi:hypothetical protein